MRRESVMAEPSAARSADEAGRMPTWRDEALQAGGTLAYGIVLQRVIPQRWHPPANTAAALAAVALARRAGASAADCGLRADALGRALRTGAVAAAGIAAGVALTAEHGRARTLFADERVSGHSGRRARFELLVRIPLATAATEEVLFRGAMLGVMLRRHSAATAIAGSSLCFGIWHVLPAVASLRSGAIGRAASERASAAAAVAGVVAVTAGAGAGLAALRMRAGNVAAPAIAHAALNASAYLAARRSGRDGGTAAASRGVAAPAR